MSEDTAISVEGVYKDFLLPHERTASLKSVFTGLLQGKRNRTTEKQHALQDINFDIKKGDFFGIVGRNGSGKSTLLKILARIYQPTKGSVTIEGRLVPFIELGVGFNAELSGRENVYLSASLMGFSRKEIDAMYDDIVDFAELEKFMDQKLKNYSSGMQVRLAFSIATRAQGDILLIDEVLAVGDADFQRKCFDYFKKLKKDKKTVVFVSHDMNAVREYCDKALLIDKSKVVYNGSSVEAAGQYSRLFSNPSHGNSTEKNQERWGDQSALFLKPTLKKVKDEKVALTFSVSAKEDIDDAVVGYYLTDQEGRQVCGTNTRLAGHALPPLVKGAKYEGTFMMPNIFGDGTYTATLALTKGNGAIADWWVSPVSFTITKTQHVPYIIDPPVDIKFRKI